MCGRFQSVRLLTPTELSNFPSDTKIIKNKPDSETRATCTLQMMKPGWIAESSWGYILCTTQGQRTTKNVCSCKPSYRLHHASLTGKSSLLTKEKWGQCPRYRGWEGTGWPKSWKLLAAKQQTAICWWSVGSSAWRRHCLGWCFLHYT